MTTDEYGYKRSFNTGVIKNKDQKSGHSTHYNSFADAWYCLSLVAYKKITNTSEIDNETKTEIYKTYSGKYHYLSRKSHEKTLDLDSDETLSDVGFADSDIDKAVMKAFREICPSYKAYAGHFDGPPIARPTHNNGQFHWQQWNNG